MYGNKLRLLKNIFDFEKFSYYKGRKYAVSSDVRGTRSFHIQGARPYLAPLPRTPLEAPPSKLGARHYCLLLNFTDNA